MTKQMQATACILHDLLVSPTNIVWHTMYADDRNECAACDAYEVEAVRVSLFHLRVLMGVAKRTISQEH